MSDDDGLEPSWVATSYALLALYFVFYQWIIDGELALDALTLLLLVGTVVTTPVVYLLAALVLLEDPSEEAVLNRE